MAKIHTIICYSEMGLEFQFSGSMKKIMEEIPDILKSSIDNAVHYGQENVTIWNKKYFLLYSSWDITL